MLSVGRVALKNTQKAIDVDITNTQRLLFFYISENFQKDFHCLHGKDHLNVLGHFKMWFLQSIDKPVHTHKAF